MNIDRDYFLTHMRSGKSLDDLGKEIADAMNAARDAYEAEEAAKAKAAKEAEEKRKAGELLETKRAIAEDMINLIKEYGDLVDPEVANCLDDYTTEDLDSMIQTMDTLFQTLVMAVNLKNMLNDPAIGGIATKVAAAPGSPIKKTVIKAPKTDDEVLTNFIKTLF